MSRYKLFVGHVSADARSKDLERFFRDHGFSKSVTEVVVKAGYGFVIFDDRRDADDAIFELNGKEFMNYKLQVEYAKPNGRSEDRGGGRYGGGGGGGGGGFRSRDNDRGGRGGRYGDREDRFASKYNRPYNTEHRVVIQNLSSRCNWQDIKDYFRQAGEVTFAKCHRERVGEGVVEFANREGMQKAVDKLNNTELFGKKLRLSFDGGQRSRSKSRSRSPKRRSRSHSRSPIRRLSRSPVRRVSRSPSPAQRRNFSSSPQRRDSRSRSRSPRRNRGESTD